jgi:hypothetical protein
MSDKRKWIDLSFTPENKKMVTFRDATNTFPTAANEFAEHPSEDLEDWVGPRYIRIHSSNIADIPKLPLGQIGVFQGVWLKTRCRITATNAIVSESDDGNLILEASSRDGVTPPVCYSLD